MTIEQTRQLGIEFERRVQAMMPNEQLEAKLTTDTIYSYLNEYTQQYVKQHIASLGSNNLTESLRKIVTDLLKFLVTNKKLEIIEDNSEIWGQNLNYDYTIWPAKCCNINDDRYLSYINSTSMGTKNSAGDIEDMNSDNTFDGTLFGIPNKYVSNEVFLELKDATTYDLLRIIRRPIVTVIDDNVLGLIHDVYTRVSDVLLTYYRKPKYFSLMTSTPCELPMSCFEDIVSGAVLLYTSYVLGVQRQREEEGRRQRAEQRAADREAERKRKEDKEDKGS